MVFKRRERRPVWAIAARALYPRGGWGRAFRYISHRLRRLPDTPEKIARGIGVGVFATFTPLYGLHFVLAAILAKILRGNIVAALLGTLFGNPLTYVPIGVVALTMGHVLLGRQAGPADVDSSFLDTFSGAGRDLWHNFTALFTSEQAEWERLRPFYDDIFFPYLIGGIGPGLVAGAIMYYLSVPVIRAYQNRRRKILRAKLSKLKAKG